MGRGGVLNDENYSLTFLYFDVVIGQLSGKAIVSAGFSTVIKQNNTDFLYIF